MACILIADDEALVRTTFRNILQRAGHEVIEAEDGQEALAIFKNHRPDLVLIDIIMPIKEGVETIAELRKVSDRVAIIAMSGGGATGSTAFLNFAEEMGANRTINKPVRSEHLLKIVGECLTVETEGAA